MKLKYEFVMVNIGDEINAVPVGDNVSEFHGIIRVNSVMRDIMELLAEETDEDSVVRAMMSRYDGVTEDEMRGHIRRAVDGLRQEGCIID